MSPAFGIESELPTRRFGRRKPDADASPAHCAMLDNVFHCIILISMRIAKTISITLPPELLLKAQKTAEREDRTISELFREALRRYISADPEWDALLHRTQAVGKALGVTTEADVERLSDEFRRARRAAH
ncbi:MAG: ribbon-helix-helix protein, CopG family [Terracidiphilus sp.]